MTIGRLLSGALLLLATTTATAELTPFEDYQFGSGVYTMDTVRVDANMMDTYLEGLEQSWVAANKVAKDLGHIVDYAIYMSQIPQSGDFNLLLVIEHESMTDLEPSKARYDEFMAAWGEAREERNRELTADYPSMRAISGSYMMREITFD